MGQAEQVGRRDQPGLQVVTAERAALEAEQTQAVTRPFRPREVPLVRSCGPQPAAHSPLPQLAVEGEQEELDSLQRAAQQARQDQGEGRLGERAVTVQQEPTEPV